MQRSLVLCVVAACSFEHGSAQGPIDPGSFTAPDAPRAIDAAAAVHGSLAVTRQLVTGSIDLSSEGTADWAEWGATSVTDFDHKATGGTQIASWTRIGSATVYGYGNGYNQAGNDGFTWTGGTPVQTETTAQYSGVWINGAPNGFSTTAPASTQARTLRLYVGGYNATGTFTAHLSDGSVADYVDVAGIGDTSSSWAGVYEVVYNSASDGAMLSVSWVQSSPGSGDVNWSAASLR